MEQFAYPGYWGCAARCGVEVVHHDVGGATVILTEVPDNPGTSVTHFVAPLATAVRSARLSGVPPGKIRWIEHYPTRGTRAATFDEVLLDWNARAHAYELPRWRRLTPAEIRQLGFEPDEVEMVTGELTRRGIPVEHEGNDVRVDGYAVTREELRALVNASRGNVEEFLRRFEKMRQVFE